MGSANPGKARSAARSASSAPALHISHPHLEQQISCTDPALGKSFGLVLDSKMLKKKSIKEAKTQPTKPNGFGKCQKPCSSPWKLG